MMNARNILCLALGLGGGLFGFSGIAQADEARVETAAPINHEQNLEILWDETFPGEKLEDIDQWARYWETDFWTPFWVGKFQGLPSARCNEIAVAAARGLSLRIKNGERITAAVIQKLGHQSPTRDTPEEAAFRRLDTSDTLRIQILSGMAQLRLINDTRVIGSLVNMLDYPSNSFAYLIYTDCGPGPDGILCKITGCEYFRYAGNRIEQYRTGQKHAQFVKGWREWLARNKNKRLIFDADVEQLVKDRIATIELQLREDMGAIPSLDHLTPQSIGRMPVGPTELCDDGVNTSLMQNFIPGLSANFYLHIMAQIGNPPLVLPEPRLPDQTGRYRLPARKQLLREVLPDTDILITIDAASGNSEFIKRLRDSVAKLPPPPDSVAVAKRQWEAVRARAVERWTKQLKEERKATQAFSALAEVGAYAPIVAALSGTNLTDQRSAIMGLAEAPVWAGDTNASVVVTPLIHILKTSAPHARYLAAWALGCIHQDDEACVAALIAAADDENVQTATTALQSLALGKFKSQEKVVIPAVIKKLSDSSAAVRAQAAQTLGEFCPLESPDQTKAVVSALIKTLSDTNDEVRINAAWALGASGNAAEAACPALLRLTNSDDANLRNSARAALMHIDSQKAKEAGL